MKKIKVLLATSLFLLFLLTLRFLWMDYFLGGDFLKAEKGILDLRNEDFSKGKSIPLNGEWAFYSEKLVIPETIGDRTINTEPKWVNIPRAWKENSLNKEQASLEQGTYSLRILLNEDNKKNNQLYFDDLYTSSITSIDGQEAVDQELPIYNQLKDAPFTVTIVEGQNEIDIVIYISDAEDGDTKKLMDSIRFGPKTIIERERMIIYSSEFMAFVVLFLHSLYAAIIYFLFGRKKEVLYLAFSFFWMSVATLADNNKLLFHYIPSIQYEWWGKILFLSYTMAVLFFVHFLKNLMKELKDIHFINWYTLLCVLFTLVVMILPLSNYMFPVLIIIMIVPALFIPPYLYRMVVLGKRDSIYLFLSTISIGSTIIWGLLKNTGWLGVQDYPYFPFDLIIAVICFSTYWFKQFLHLSEDSRKMAAELQKVDKHRDEFLANTSHELRNPLHGIINIAQAVLKKEEHHLNKDSKGDLQLLISVGQRMSLLLNDLLDTTRLKEGRIHLEVKSVNLNSVVSVVFDMLSFMKGDKEIRFVCEIQDSFPNVRADEHRLIQIFFNLIHNAVKFSHNGKITVSAEIRNGVAVVSVEDCGIGMSRESLQSIFQPYEQGNSDTKMMGEGIGLGLSVCKQLIELHGGTISVSPVLNEGTTFTFTLPIAAEKAEEVGVRYDVSKLQEEKGQEDSVSDGHSRLLLVDDDPVNLKIFSQILMMEGYKVVSCTSGEEVLKELMKGQIDLVISDVMMPNMSGYELTRKIRELYTLSEMPVLLLTARTQVEDIQTGFMAGANDYAKKPIDKLEFLARVKALTEIKRSINERVRLEAAWLQAQIQPHFLFNTLNTIAALSEVNVEKMSILMNEFGNYLRASFDTRNLEKVIPIDKELELVRSYLYIEQQRFGDRLTIEWNIDSLVDIQIPPLSIQTIVENAVNHGVLKQLEVGNVRIEIIERSDDVMISIIDDGVGMSEDTIASLFVSGGGNRNGIGLSNTDKRLKQLYDRGLSIISAVNQGTSVTFYIPTNVKTNEAVSD